MGIMSKFKRKTIKEEKEKKEEEKNKKKKFYNEIKKIKFSYTNIDTIEKLLKENDKELDELIALCDKNIKEESISDKSEKKSITSKYLKEIKTLATNLKQSFSNNKLSINTLTRKNCFEELSEFINASKELRFKFFEIFREKFFKHPTAALNYRKTKKYFGELAESMIYCLSKFQKNLRRESIKILVNAINGKTSTTMSESKFIYIPHVNCINVATIELKKDNLKDCAEKAYNELIVGACYEDIDKKDWYAVKNCAYPTKTYRSYDLKEDLPIY